MCKLISLLDMYYIHHHKLTKLYMHEFGNRASKMLAHSIHAKNRHRLVLNRGVFFSSKQITKAIHNSYFSLCNISSKKKKCSLSHSAYKCLGIFTPPHCPLYQVITWSHLHLHLWGQSLWMYLKKTDTK